MTLKDILDNALGIGLIVVLFGLVFGFIEAIASDNASRQYNFARPLALSVLMTALLVAVVTVCQYIW